MSDDDPKKKTRGARGRGSIIRYGDRWAGIVELPADPNNGGGRRRKWIYGDKKADVARAMDDARSADKRRQRVGNDEEQFAVYLERWIRETIRPLAKMRPSTKLSYESVVNRHLVPEIGKLSIREMTPTTVKAFYSRLRDAGAGDRTLQKVHAVLHRALGELVALAVLEQNPAKALTDSPKYEAPEREPLTRDQVRTLLRAAVGDRFETLYVMALTTGARQGELFALQWGDVDLESGMITIRRSLQDVDGKGTLSSGPTKTRKGRRFALADRTVKSLIAHRDRMQAEGLRTRERDLVFASTNGEPLRRQNFLRRSFYPLLEQAGLPMVHFHDLRHTVATHLGLAGMPVVQVSQLLGHSNPAVTLKVYSHAFESAAGDASKKLDELFDDRRSSRR